MLEHLVAPRQPASRLSTIHVPRLTLDMVAECINDGHSVIGLWGAFTRRLSVACLDSLWPKGAAAR